MSVGKVQITGIGCVSPFGPAKGLIGPGESTPRVISAWPTNGIRKAHLVEPFHPADIVPGLKTRRLDRLSIWSLVAAFLALQDARIKLESEDGSRCAVVFGTGFGPIELTEAYFRSVASCGHNKSDPIVFPETLDNSPASHVARSFGLKGPNVTVSCRGVSGEAALIQAASILESGEADLAVVLAGDTLTQTLYEWYETAKVLAPTCFGDMSVPASLSRSGNGFVPGEGLAAFVMEACGRYMDRGAKAYACYRGGCMGGDPTVEPFSWGNSSRLTVELIHLALGSADPSNVRLVVASGNGSPSLDAMEARAIQEVFGPSGTDVIAPKALLGEFDGNAILRLTLALSDLQRTRGPQAVSQIDNSTKTQSCCFQSPKGDIVLLLGASTGGGRAALSFILP